jgi:hypothetical protein
VTAVVVASAWTIATVAAGPGPGANVVVVAGAIRSLVDGVVVADVVGVGGIVAVARRLGADGVVPVVAVSTGVGVARTAVLVLVLVGVA